VQTPLSNLPLPALIKTPIMFDANILMVGIENRGHDLNCSFENMKELYIGTKEKSIVLHMQRFTKLTALVQKK